MKPGHKTHAFKLTQTSDKKSRVNCCFTLRVVPCSSKQASKQANKQTNKQTNKKKIEKKTNFWTVQCQPLSFNCGVIGVFQTANSSTRNTRETKCRLIFSEIHQVM
jgi:hypothetical protein